MTDVLRALAIGGAVFALCYAVHICGRMLERADEASRKSREEALDRAFEAARKPEMPELADTDYYTVWHLHEDSNGNVAFFAPRDKDAAAYLICRSAREAVS